MNLQQVFAILIFLTVFSYILRKQDFLELKKTVIIVTPAPYKPDDFCTFKPLSPEDAEEERLLLNSIAWPETPHLPSPLSLNQTSDPAHSVFTILPHIGGGEWHVGDQLVVMIQMYDFHANSKKCGGDFLIARLHSPTHNAGVAGRVVDHLDGSYSAVFTLPWEGNAQIKVTLIHPTEAITVLRRLTREHPDRVHFESLFQSGSVSERTTCNVCLRQTNQPQCNFTDLHTRDPWFCYKPKNLSCESRVSHMRAQYKVKLKANEEKLFQSKVNMKALVQAAGPSSVTVLPKRKDQPTVSKMSGLSGYYYQGVWRPLDGTKIHQFKNSSAIRKCLQGKRIHLYGDSTIRQWFEFLQASLPDAHDLIRDSPKKTGPYMIWEETKDILVTYRVHGPPLSFIHVPTSQLHFIANELDELLGGPNTVVVIGIWAHFCPFPIELYIRRLLSIRRAVIRLLNRAPGTLVVIKTGNLRDVTANSALCYSDWYAFQQDKVLRAVFKGLKVKMVDAWEMTLANHLLHNVHPANPILRNMIDIFLSYICPQ